MDSVMVNTNAHVPRLLLEHSVQVRTRIFEIKIIQLCFFRGINCFFFQKRHGKREVEAIFKDWLATSVVYRFLDPPCVANQISRLPDSRSVGCTNVQIVSKVVEYHSASDQLFPNLTTITKGISNLSGKRDTCSPNSSIILRNAENLRVSMEIKRTCLRASNMNKCKIKLPLIVSMVYTCGTYGLLENSNKV